MAWRVALCLVDLLAEVNAVAPNRKKGRDGTIGDTAHQARASRHNPNAAGVVTARDVTDDPAGGMPVHVYARALIARPDLIPVDLDYVISNGQVASRERGPWTWRPYDGADPHDLHAHFGVGRGPDSAPIGPYDDHSNWHVAELLRSVHTQAASPATIAHVQEDDDMPVKMVSYATPDGHGAVYSVFGNQAKWIASQDDVTANEKMGVEHITDGGKPLPAHPFQSGVIFVDGPLKNV